MSEPSTVASQPGVVALAEHQPERRALAARRVTGSSIFVLPLLVTCTRGVRARPRSRPASRRRQLPRGRRASSACHPRRSRARARRRRCRCSVPGVERTTWSPRSSAAPSSPRPPGTAAQVERTARGGVAGRPAERRRPTVLTVDAEDADRGTRRAAPPASAPAARPGTPTSAMRDRHRRSAGARGSRASSTGTRRR